MEEERERDNVVGRDYNEVRSGMIDSSIAALILDANHIIDQIEHDLRGEFFFVGVDEGGMAVKGWRKSGMQMINDEGIRAVVSVLHTYITPNTFLSNLDDIDVEKIMVPLDEAVTDMLADMQEEWGIEDAYLKILRCKITDTILVAFKRSLFAKTLTAFTTSQKGMEMRQISPKKRKLLPF